MAKRNRKFASRTLLKLKKNKGFTLLELVIVIAIFGVLAAIIVFNHSRFTSQTVVTNMAYEIALEVRESQVFGLGVRKGADFNIGYGAYFDLAGGPVNDFAVFSSPLPYPKMDTGNEIDRFRLGRGITITGLIYQKDGNCQNADNISIGFARPDPDAYIVYTDAGSGASGDNADLAQIKIEPQRAGLGLEKYILVRRNGQISVIDLPACT